MAKEKVIILKVENEQAVESISEVGAEINDAKKESNELSASVMDNIKNFKIFGVSINSVTKGLKLLRVSLIATGIGAIAVAVGTLAAGFMSTQRGADALNSILKPLSEVLQTIWGVVQKLGTGLFEMVSGDVTEGFNTMASAVDNLGDSMDEAWRRGKRLYELTIEIRELEMNEITAVAKLRRQASAQRFISEDRINKTLEERIAALDLAIQSEDAILNIQEATIKARIEEMKLSQMANDTDIEGKKELLRLEAELEGLYTTRDQRARTIETRRQSLLAEGKSKGTKDKVDPVTGLTPRDMEDLRGELEIHIDEVGALLSGQAKMQKRHAKEDYDREKKKLDDKKAMTTALVDVTADALYTLADLAGKNTAEGKALSIAASIINTYQAITKTLAAYPGPVGIAMSVATGLAGFAAVKSIYETKVPGYSGGGGGGISVPSQPQAPQFNIVGEGGTNQVVDAINDRNTQPVRAYVVGADVSTQQGLDRNTIENATVI